MASERVNRIADALQNTLTLALIRVNAYTRTMLIDIDDTFVMPVYFHTVAKILID